MLMLSHRPLRLALLTLALASAVLLLRSQWTRPTSFESLEPKIDPPPYTAVFVYLVSAHRTAELLDSLTSIYHNVQTAQPWPIVLLHTGDFDHISTRTDLVNDIRAQIMHESTSPLSGFADRIEFVKLSFPWPDRIPKDRASLNPVFPAVWPGYHQMCAFYTSAIFDLPRLADVTFYLRLDTDSIIEAPFCFDPFEYMYVRNRSYGYRAIGYDPPEVTRGMWTFLDDYVQKHKSVADRLKANDWIWPWTSDDGEDMVWETTDSEDEERIVHSAFPGYQNNFEIVRLESFRRPEVKAWLEEVMSVPERAFKWRWGDSPLRYATVQMFFDAERETEHMCAIPYFHQQHYDDQCLCVPL